MLYNNIAASYEQTFDVALSVMSPFTVIVGKVDILIFKTAK